LAEGEKKKKGMASEILLRVFGIHLSLSSIKQKGKKGERCSIV